MKKLTNTKKARGFTIVELLVVIVVIGILAAISIVSYSGVTNKANNTKAVSAVESVQSLADAYYAEKGSYPISSTDVSGFTTVSLPAATSVKVDSAVLTSAATTGTPVKVRYGYCTTGYTVQYWDLTKAAGSETITSTTGTCASPTYVALN